MALSTAKEAGSIVHTVSNLIKSMRPNQWTKNILFVFPAIVFSEQLFELELLGRVIVCCILLILSSGCVYIINDLTDIEADRAHPVKRLRSDRCWQTLSIRGQSGSCDPTPALAAGCIFL